MLSNPYQFAYLILIVQFNQHFVIYDVISKLTNNLHSWDGKYAQSCTIVFLRYKVFCYLHKRDLFWYRHSLKVQDLACGSRSQIKNVSTTKVLFTYEYTWQNFRLWLLRFVNNCVESIYKKQKL